MPVTIEHITVLNIGGSADWKVKKGQIVEVDGQQFVKLRSSEYSLVRLVTEGMLGDGKLPKNPSLSACTGMRELVRLRNEKQRHELTSEVQPQSALFKGTVAPPRKTIRQTSAKIKDLRDNPQSLTVDVPGFDGRPTMPIQMIRPVHPCDDIAVPLNEEQLDHVFGFIRHLGIDADTLSAKRVYASSGSECRGIWKSGDGYVVKTEDSRYKRAKTLDDAMKIASGDNQDLAPIEDQGDSPRAAPDGKA